MISLLQFFRRWPRRVAPLAPRKRTRTPTIGARFESLESRCLLSLTPASDFWISPDPLRPEQIADIPSGIVAGIVGTDSDVEKGWLPDSREWVSLPPANDNSPPPPDPLGDWSPPGDSWTPEAPIETPPDWSDQGGPVDLGSWTNPDKGTETKSNDDSKEVLSVLAALSYVPSPRSDAAGGPVVASLETTSPAPASSAATEGGAIAIDRGQLVEPEATHDAGHEAWLEAPVQVESMRSRFQAFEISTAQQLSAAAASPSAECDDSPSSSSHTPVQSLPSLDDIIWGTLPTDVSPPANPPATDDAEVEEEEPLVAPPADDRISLSLNAAAVAILMAWLAPVTRTVAHEDLTQPGATTERRPWLRGLLT